MTTTVIRSRSVQQLFEESQAAGFRTMIYGKAASSCCHGGHRRATDVLIEPQAISSFAEFLGSFGFYPVATSRLANATTVSKFLGYCESCATFTQLNVFCELTVGDVRGNHVVLKNTLSVFESIKATGLVHATQALEALSNMCAASLSYEYQVRHRKKLMAQARACFIKTDPRQFQLISSSLIGEEATKFVIKLMEVEVEREIDLLLYGLRSELSTAQEVDYIAGNPIKFIPAAKSAQKLRLTTSQGEIRRAPVIVVAHADPADTSTVCAIQQLSEKLDCRAITLVDVAGTAAGDVQYSSTDSRRWQSIRLAVNAVTTAWRNHRRYVRAGKIARKGMPVIIRGNPVVDFPGECSVPKLKHWADAANPMRRLAARLEGRIYRKICSVDVDLLIVIAARQITRPRVPGGNAFEIRRRSRAMEQLPVNTKNRKNIEAFLSAQEIQAQIIEQVLVAVADR